MINLITELNPWVLICLFLALMCVLAFEFINGFHDTANAVATVIYTKSMSPRIVVCLSGLFNFLGVMLGGLGVAYAIVHILPIDMLVHASNGHGLVLVFSILVGAITWNLGTWYFGIPASSSHTLIGSIIGVSLTNAVMRGDSIGNSVNFGQIIGITKALVFSPLAGFIIAGLMLLIFKWWRPKSKMHISPEQRSRIDNKKKPPFWTRMVLVLSALGVSFVHGSNDGQKGIGLVMLALVGIAPGFFVLDLNTPIHEINRTRDAAIHLNRFYESEHLFPLENTNIPVASREYANSTRERVPRAFFSVLDYLKDIQSYQQLTENQRIEIRESLLYLNEYARELSDSPTLPESDKSNLESLRKDLISTTEYAPFWAIVAVALAIGFGTAIGWRRIVKTIGEKIGNQGMTYAQGIAAQVTSTLAIAMANYVSLPVSTTHILSSGVAGTHIANRSGLQGKTIRTIIFAWLLTLPAGMLLSAIIFYLTSNVFL